MGFNGSLYNYIIHVALITILLLPLIIVFQPLLPNTNFPPSVTQLQNVQPGINFQNYDWHYQANEGSYPLATIAG